MVKKIRTRNKVNKRNKKRSLKKMKGGADRGAAGADKYYIINSTNPELNLFNGVIVTGTIGGTFNYYMRDGSVPPLVKNDITQYKKCCEECIGDIWDQSEIMRHLASYCHTCGLLDQPSS